MDLSKINNINVKGSQPILSPADLHQELPAADEQLKLVQSSRQTIQDILEGKDKRLFVVIGPCSVHDPDAAMEYARQSHHSC